jgi:hypothetical protein
MLTYHPAFDIYHTVFRILKVLTQKPGLTIEIDRLRLFDYFLLFPHEIKKVTLPAGTGEIRKKFKDNKYNFVPNSKRVFSQIEKHQQLALKCLLSYELIDPVLFEDNKVKLGNKEIPEELRKAIENTKSINHEILNFLVEQFLTMSLSTFKQRSHLMEYRYDVT